MLLQKLTTELIDKCYIQLNNPENKLKLQQNILDPIINYMYEKLFPQFLTIIILFIIITFLSIINFSILISVYFSKQK